MAWLILPAWILLPLLVPLGVLWIVRSPRLSVVMKNTLATGVAAAGVVIGTFLVLGLTRIGGLSDTPIAGWVWRVPLFTAAVATFAFACGWAVASLWFGLRQFARGRWGEPGCPSAMHLAVAWAVLLALLIAYTEGAVLLADLMRRPLRL